MKNLVVKLSNSLVIKEKYLAEELKKKLPQRNQKSGKEIEDN